MTKTTTTAATAATAAAQFLFVFVMISASQLMRLEMAGVFAIIQHLLKSAFVVAAFANDASPVPIPFSQIRLGLSFTNYDIFKSVASSSN